MVFQVSGIKNKVINCVQLKIFENIKDLFESGHINYLSSQFPFNAERNSLKPLTDEASAENTFPAT
jgi:hypothetical protein